MVVMTRRQRVREKERDGGGGGGGGGAQAVPQQFKEHFIPSFVNLWPLDCRAIVKRDKNNNNNNNKTKMQNLSG